MSNQAALPLRRRLPRVAGPAVTRARLSVVPRRRTRTPQVPFVTLVSLVLVGGVVGLLLFNTSMQQASFAATSLEEQARVLTAREQTLRMELDDLRDPQRVAEAAQAMGMVPALRPAFLRLEDGKVVGAPTPATPADGLRIQARPPRKPAVLTPDPIVHEEVADTDAGRRGSQRSGGNDEGRDQNRARRR
jgi:cell division protein FtsB